MFINAAHQEIRILIKQNLLITSVNIPHCNRCGLKKIEENFVAYCEEYSRARKKELGVYILNAFPDLLRFVRRKGRLGKW